MSLSIEKKLSGLFFLSLLLAVFLYLPGLNGNFIFDDNSNIALNTHLQFPDLTFENIWQASWSNNSGMLKRPVAMLSFAMNVYFNGMDPWSMKLVNLFIHLINAILVLLVMKMLINSIANLSKCKINSEVLVFFPYFIAIVWLLHPLNVTSVSYIVQRMNSLSSMFMLGALYCYLGLRAEKLASLKGYILTTLMLALCLFGMFTKETALSLTLYVLVLEFSVFRFLTFSAAQKRHLFTLLIVLSAPWIVGLLYALYEPSFVLNSYSQRSFNLYERLLTEFRVVSEYLRLVLLPDVGSMGLFHDDIVISRSLLAPYSTLTSVLFLSVLLFLSLRYNRQMPFFATGILWFLAGHVLESSIFALELMFLHRNYLPMLGILLALCEIPRLYYKHCKKYLIFIFITVITGLSLLTHLTVAPWSGDTTAVLSYLLRKPESIRANIQTGQIFTFLADTSADEKTRALHQETALRHFGKVRQIDPDDITGELLILESRLKRGNGPLHADMEALNRIIPKVHIRSRTVNVMRSINRCIIEKSCEMDAHRYHALMQALLANQNLSGQMRAELLGNYATYEFEHEQRLVSALEKLEEAISIAPEMFELYELAIYYHDKQHNTEAMLALVNRLEQKDTLRQYSTYIALVREVASEQTQ